MKARTRNRSSKSTVSTQPEPIRSLSKEQLSAITGGYGTNGDIHVGTPP
jgi:hypothetical protein